MKNTRDRLAGRKGTLSTLETTESKPGLLENSKGEAIAIIGAGCRFPGGADSPEAFWQRLRDGVDAIGEVPADRWDIEAYYDPNPEAPGKMYSRCGGFLSRVDTFDPEFFGISPREAVSIDPQQRLLLEVSWEALENANQAPEHLYGSSSGVFIGICYSDYATVKIKCGDPSVIDAYYGTGSALSVAAGRLSYILGLTGPSMAVDTACSSSLVTVHLACQSLRLRECDLALAGGVHLIIGPENSIACSRARMLAVDGRCKSFDAAADGYGRGEGCGVIVLKRLSDALASGDKILALIRGSAVNHDGLSNGLTAPNGPAQQAVIRRALKNGGVQPSEVSYVEAHGTGTPLGDPIEVGALGAVFGKNRENAAPLLIGSVKTNIGHLEGSAGIAGLLKVVLSLQHEEIPPHLHFREPSPHILWKDFSVAVPTERTSWPAGSKPRIAGVSSFGFSGTNAHVVLEEASAPKPLPAAEGQRPWHLLTLSAKTAEALKQLARRYESQLTADPAVAIEDICYSANTGRSHFHQRLSIVACSTAEMGQKLAGFIAGQELAGVCPGQGTTAQAKVAFLFTGQGSQYVEMGRQLYETQPTFRRTLQRCAEVLGPSLEKPLLEVLYPGPGRSSPLNETAYTQPALFALEYALAELWQSWGIKPSAVMGHSVGEYVAACVAGVFSLEEGLQLIAERARLMQALPAEGEMVAVLASEARVAAALDGQEVSIAAINGPQNVVISGLRRAVQAVVSTLAAEGVKTSQLKVSHAFHSALMEPMMAAFGRAAAAVNFSPPRISLISNLTGRLVTDEIATPEYWVDHVRQPVRFATGINTLYQRGSQVFVEIGPKPTLLGLGRQCLPESSAMDKRRPLQWIPSLHQEQQDWPQLLSNLGRLYALGLPVDWRGFDRDYPRRRLSLPTYPFQRQRHWIETTGIDFHKNAAFRTAAKNESMHALLGKRCNLPGTQEIRFESQISQDSSTFLRHHCIFGSAIMPASAYLEMALAAGADAFRSDNLVVEGVVIQQALILPEDKRTRVHLILIPEDATVFSFQIFGSTSDEEIVEPLWTLHASGKIILKDHDLELPAADLSALQALCTEEIPVESYYQKFRRRGIHYGSSFQAVRRLWRQQGEAIGQIRLPDSLVAETANFKLHPVILDACFQVAGFEVSGAASADDSDKALYFPAGIARLTVYRPPGPSGLWSHVKVRSIEDSIEQTAIVDLSLFDATGATVAVVEGLIVKRANRKVLLHSPEKDLADCLYTIAWHSQVRHSKLEALAPEEAKNWVIFAEREGLGIKLASQLKERGQNCDLVFAGQAYETDGDTHYYINPTEPADFRRLLQDLRTRHTASQGNNYSPLHGAVFAWNLEGIPCQAMTAAALQNGNVLGCESVLSWVQALAEARWSGSPRLWLVTRGAQSINSEVAPLQVQQSSLWGLGRVIALEHPGLHCVRLDLEPLGAPEEIGALLQELWSPDKEDQIAWRQGVRYVARLARHALQGQGIGSQLQTSSVEPYQLRISGYGVLDNLTLVPMTRRPPGPGEVEIRVLATGLNFRDVLHALGMLKEHAERLGIQSAADMPFGFECAGRIETIGENVVDLKVGDEVIAALTIGSLSSFVTVTKEFVVAKPKDLSFEEAATLPTAFLTAVYGLHHLAEIRAGDQVLIHSAAGGVGQAALMLAQRAGAEVFATASPGKWEFLRSQGVKHVMNSRTLDFADEVMAITEGKGVSIVLNSLNGEFIPKSIEILGTAGRFVELGKIGIWDRQRVNQLRNDVSYYSFDLSEVAQDDPQLIADLLKKVMLELGRGGLRPLPLRVFPLREVVKAFRYMGQAKHIGKVAISQTSEAAIDNDATKRELVCGNASYLITGGLGALGLRVAQWMIGKGARHLMLNGRGKPSKAARETIGEMEQAGAKVVVVNGDVSKQEDVARLLEVARNCLPPLRGIIHAAGILDDGLLLQQDAERFRRVMAPKVQGTWNLHALSQDLPLDFFVCFSSAASLLGSPGQGNYAAANSFMDALMHYRQALALPGMSINWGAWAEIGMAAEKEKRHQRRMANLGLDPIVPEEGLLMLEEFLKKGVPQVGVLPVNWSKFLPQYDHGAEQMFFEQIMPVPERSGRQQSECFQQLAAAPVHERRDLLMVHICAQIAKVLSLNSPCQIEPRQKLFELGLDSLMAVELKSSLESSLGCAFPTTLLFDYPTAEALADHLAKEFSERLSAEVPVELSGSDETVGASAEWERLSQSDMADLLEEKLNAVGHLTS